MAAVALVMAFVALPCFAEIRVKREGATVNNMTVNKAVYWNDKYCIPRGRSAKELAKKFGDDFREFSRDNFCFTFTFHVYWDYEGHYEVFLKEIEIVGTSVRSVQACYFYDNGYREDLYNKIFSSPNAAKAKFDSLCRQYYNEIPR